MSVVAARAASCASAAASADPSRAPAPSRGAPQDLRADVFLGGHFLARARVPFRLVVPPLLVEHVRERRRHRRAQLVLTHRLEAVVPRHELALRRLEIARQLLDPCRHHSARGKREVIPSSS